MISPVEIFLLVYFGIPAIGFLMGVYFLIREGDIGFILLVTLMIAWLMFPMIFSYAVLMFFVSIVVLAAPLSMISLVTDQLPSLRKKSKTSSN